MKRLRSWDRRKSHPHEHVCFDRHVAGQRTIFVRHQHDHVHDILWRPRQHARADFPIDATCCSTTSVFWSIEWQVGKNRISEVVWSVGKTSAQESRTQWRTLLLWSHQCIVVEWFFSRHVQFDSRFHVMMVNKIAWDGPEIISSFTIIQRWLLKRWWRPVWFSWKLGWPGLRLMFPDPDLLQIFLNCSICDRERVFRVLGLNTSFALSLLAWISDASIFPNSSTLGTKMSPFQIPPECNT